MNSVMIRSPGCGGTRSRSAPSSKHWPSGEMPQEALAAPGLPRSPSPYGVSPAHQYCWSSLWSGSVRLGSSALEAPALAEPQVMLSRTCSP